jgi:8-oxo-dGTP pyrophosphatase MutT (NUDIX family)
VYVDYAKLREALATIPPEHCRAAPGYRRAGVCLVLFDRSQTRVLAIQKADRAGYHWRNHVALPGGYIEPQDCSGEEAALREVREELGILPTELEVLGGLGHFQTVSSNRDLEVVVARWQPRTPLRPDPVEVGRVFDVPVCDLVAWHEDRGLADRRVADLGDRLVYPLPDVVAWGVTARILHAFLERLRQICGGVRPSAT